MLSLEERLCNLGACRAVQSVPFYLSFFYLILVSVFKIRRDASAIELNVIELNVIKSIVIESNAIETSAIDSKTNTKTITLSISPTVRPLPRGSLSLRGMERAGRQASR